MNKGGRSGETRLARLGAMCNLTLLCQPRLNATTTLMLRGVHLPLHGPFGNRSISLSHASTSNILGILEFWLMQKLSLIDLLEVFVP